MSSILDLAAQHRDAIGEAATAKRNAAAALCGWKRNQISTQAGIHPSQIQEAIAAARKRGVDIDFTPTGEAIFKSRAHKKEYLQKVRGLIDMDAGYGDAMSKGVNWHFNENPY